MQSRSTAMSHRLGQGLAHDWCRRLRFGHWFSHAQWCDNHRRCHRFHRRLHGQHRDFNALHCFSQSAAKTFSTGTGAVTLSGATTIATDTAFTVGATGSTGTSTIHIHFAHSGTELSRPITVRLPFRGGHCMPARQPHLGTPFHALKPGF